MVNTIKAEMDLMKKTFTKKALDTIDQNWKQLQ